MTKWKGKSRGGAFGYLFFIFLIKKIGIRAAYIFLGTIVSYFILFAPKATKSIWNYSRKTLNLNVIHSIKMLFLNYYRLGQTLIDKVAVGNGMKDKYNFRFENYDKFLDILNADTGAIIIGAHIGNWEIGTPFFDEYGKKINIVLYDAEYQRIKDVLQQNTVSADFKIISVNNSDLNHVFAIKEALDNKEYICFQGDRYVNEERCLKTTFMGKEANFPLGPFLLAAKMKAPVVFYFAMRERKKTYRFHFIQATSYRKEDNIRSEQQLLNQYVSAVESVICKYPEQWFNYYKFWNEK
ncbi:acyltransferase [Dysgonomonas sp. Marseille-P4677]|uniref:LpxL/LpxP family acyltransferase n=1 Tax=Dysgonomonas sp. Marseille-P4677 TaxID=2364790 RepID=UPI00191188AE|nr:acyltransferase [Dysgonomonas sp. Marseille-P4677]MBK5720092.1 acyltransferase [Dysgonomonas sp. Marseille-P4677]